MTLGCPSSTPDRFDTPWRWTIIHRSVWRLQRVVSGRPEHFAICYIGGLGIVISRTLDDQKSYTHDTLREAKAFIDAMCREE